MPPKSSSSADQALHESTMSAMNVSFSAGFDDGSAWGAPPPSSGDIVGNAIKKEKVIKEITTAQEDLRAMMAKAKAVQADIDKLVSGNDTLQMYIDNLTMQMAKRR
ncbi:uncharacterized protein BXZ73DRAFT_104058 [Epithele typhae]|uniref:uncharacterized protein n=1 Tax=Epithele typhae TaxID=378194 RepID=UPI002007D2D7|nr:uncharacterized protein BXZ73DRAFT_104058 [Epithele typhae]KAH9922825.1 hypothetical protein BXZ73DRAFT_104058 [Epithele typhae]